MDFTRAGQFEVAQQDTYQRVYTNSGTYTMPRNLNNGLHVRGEFCWDGDHWQCKAEGQQEEVSDVRLLQNTLLPKLDAKTEELSRELNRIIVVRYQHDSAAT